MLTQPHPASSRPGSLRRFFEVLGESSWSLVKLNVLFLISCLPLLTLGPALTALSACIRELIEGDLREERPFHSYRVFFVSCFRVSFFWGLAVLAAGSILITAVLFYGKQAGENWFFVPLTALSLLAILLLGGFFVHLFPFLSEDKKPDLPRLAVLTALERMGKTLTAFLISAVLLCIQVLFLPVSLPLLLSLGFAVPALICGLAHTEGPEDINASGPFGKNH